MHRRALLAGLTGSLLSVGPGCAVREGCSDVSIDAAYVQVEYWCDYGANATTLRIRGDAENCPGELAVEIVTDGEVRRSVPLDGGGSWAIPSNSEGFTMSGPARVRVRGPDDEVRAEEAIEIDHYLDEPDVSIRGARSSTERETVVGEPATVDVEIANGGAGAEYVASLLVDGEPVDRREGTVENGPGCGRSWPEHSFTHEFDEPGEYELAIRLELPGADSTADEQSAGTVTVHEQ